MTEYNNIESFFPQHFAELHKNFDNTLNPHIDYVELMCHHLEYNKSRFEDVEKIFMEKLTEKYPSLNSNVLYFIVCVLYYNNKLNKDNLVSCLKIFKIESQCEKYSHRAYINSYDSDNFSVCDGEVNKLFSYDIFNFSLPSIDYEIPTIRSSWLNY